MNLLREFVNLPQICTSHVDSLTSHLFGLLNAYLTISQTQRIVDVIICQLGTFAVPCKLAGLLQIERCEALVPEDARSAKPAKCALRLLQCLHAVACQETAAPLMQLLPVEWRALILCLA